MNDEPDRHPADRLLTAFDLGELGEGQAAAVRKHLKVCQPCRRRLVGLSPNQTELPANKKEDSSPTVRIIPDGGPERSDLPAQHVGRRFAPTATGSLRKNPASRSGIEALTAAVHADSPPESPIVPRRNRRRPTLLWLEGTVGVALLGLILAWGGGAFEARNNSATTIAEDRSLPAAAEPAIVADQRPLDPPSETNEATPAPSPRPTPSDAPAPLSPLGDVKEARQRGISPKSDADQTVATVTHRESEKTPAQALPDSTSHDTQPLFNGKDLTDWEGAPGVWKVDNGAIVGSLPAGQKGSAFLCSKRKYKDFDLRFRAAAQDGLGDSGVLFRSRLVDLGKIQVVGPECAIFGTDAPKEHRSGSLIGERDKVERAAPARLARFLKPTENHFRIRCQGKHVLIEVNGIKVVNGEFSSVPEEGVIAWKIDGERPPRKVLFKNIKFTDLSRSSPANHSDQPPLRDAELLRAQIKFCAAINSANDKLLKQFESEISKRQKSSRAPDKELLPVVEAEREAFKNKGLIPWSKPMRHGLKTYSDDLRVALEAVGKAFDKAIERAKKCHNDKLEAALLEEAAQTLAPREVATWEIKDQNDEAIHRVFYSDATYADGNQPDEANSRFWKLPSDDGAVILEFPDKNTTGALQRGFLLTPDGKTMTTWPENGQPRVWQRVED
jgi:Domain of Unknown Function (DUF1080)/Putative zinc-finger